MLGACVLNKLNTRRLNFGETILLKRKENDLGECNALDIFTYFCYYLDSLVEIFLFYCFVKNKFCLQNCNYIKDFTLWVILFQKKPAFCADTFWRMHSEDKCLFLMLFLLLYLLIWDRNWVNSQRSPDLRGHSWIG